MKSHQAKSYLFDSDNAHGGSTQALVKHILDESASKSYEHYITLSIWLRLRMRRIFFLSPDIPPTHTLKWIREEVMLSLNVFPIKCMHPSIHITQRHCCYYNKIGTRRRRTCTSIHNSHVRIELIYVAVCRIVVAMSFRWISHFNDEVDVISFDLVLMEILDWNSELA